MSELAGHAGLGLTSRGLVEDVIEWARKAQHKGLLSRRTHYRQDASISVLAMNERA